MGSGRGAARRVQAATQAEYDESKWRAFTKSGGLVNYTAKDYYLGAGSKSLTPKNQEASEKLLQEFLRDAVEFGALTLPTGVGAEELQLTYDAPTNAYSASTIHLAVMKNGKRVAGADTTMQLRRYLTASAKMTAFGDLLYHFHRLLSSLA